MIGMVVPIFGAIVLGLARDPMRWIAIECSKGWPLDDTAFAMASSIVSSGSLSLSPPLLSLPPELTQYIVAM